MSLIEAVNLTTGYGQRPAISDVSLSVGEGEAVALIGHNGAGKTTTLKAIFGLLSAWNGDVIYAGGSVTGRSPSENVREGMSYMPQEHALFPDLSVGENLEMAAYVLGNANGLQQRVSSIHELFPILNERVNQKASTLSGGEQRMLSFGMALMLQPRVIMLDEPSLGLGPRIVQRLFDMVTEIRGSYGVSFLLVEQNIPQALRVSQRVYVMKAGRIVLEQKSHELLERGYWWDLF